jgi:hypothetical protein
MSKDIVIEEKINSYLKEENSQKTMTIISSVKVDSENEKLCGKDCQHLEVKDDRSRCVIFNAFLTEEKDVPLRNEPCFEFAKESD